jgi:hypothetical protein
MRLLKQVGNNLSILAIILSVAFTAYYISSRKIWKDGKGTIYWDTIHYYSYLPAVFIYKDLSLKFIEKDPQFFGDKIWPDHTREGLPYIKTTSGLSMLYAPFFFTAHFYAQAAGYEASGYSPPYHAILIFSSLFYLVFGLFFLRSILRRYFSETITAITLLVTLFGTNLFAYTTIYATMSHSYNFSLIVLFIWLSLRWHDQPKTSTAIFLGLCYGLITLIRPTNGLVALVFIFYSITSLKELQDKAKLFLSRWADILLILLCSFVVFIPQLLYWKTYLGEWVFFSYNTERFFWSEPVLWKGLFGFRKGWLIYTPVMITGIAGFFFLRNKVPGFRWVVPAFILLSFYVVVSWWCWWYGGGLGMRPMVDYYGLMALGIAALLDRISQMRWYAASLLSLVFAYFSLLGVYHFHQFRSSMLHWDSMTREAYWFNFGKFGYDPGVEPLLEHPEYEKAKLERK